MRNLGNIILLRDGYCSAPVANEREPLDRYRPTPIFTQDPVNKQHYIENDFHLTSEPNNTNEQE